MARNEAVGNVERQCKACGAALAASQRTACSVACRIRVQTRLTPDPGPPGTCTWCGVPLTGRQRVACSPLHRSRSDRARRLSEAPELLWSRQRSWRDRNRERVKTYWRTKNFSRYGVTEEWFRDQLVGQAGRCAICGEVMAPGRGTHIDHDHLTGRVRGLLCSNCNTAIGLFAESPRVLMAALRYLEVPDASE